MILYLIAINIITFCAFCWDKYCAVNHKWRVPESTLIGLAVLGGSVGAFAAMQIVRHKTRHWKFTVGVPVIFLLQLLVWMYR